MARDWSAAGNVLCIRLDAIGDVLMTTPAIRALRGTHPDRRITLLASPHGAEIARLVPDIDRIMVYEAPWMKATEPRADAGADFGLIERLRAERFDAAVIFTVYSQSPLPAALCCYLAGIPLRMAHCRENPYQLLSHWILDAEPHRLLRHEVQRQLDLVASVGCAVDDDRMRLELREKDRDAATMRLQSLGINPAKPWVVVHPGATAPSRRYPSQQFVQACRALVRKHHCQVVFTGSRQEVALIEDIRARMRAPSFSLAGELDLRALAAVIAIAPVLVVNNTGPAHIAAALGTPVVDLYALTNLQHMPWRVDSRVLYHEVPCKSCYKSICPEGHHACLRMVSPDRVVSATLELLRVGKGSQPQASGSEHGSSVTRLLQSATGATS